MKICSFTRARKIEHNASRHRKKKSNARARKKLNPRRKERIKAGEKHVVGYFSRARSEREREREPTIRFFFQFAKRFAVARAQKQLRERKRKRMRALVFAHLKTESVFKLFFDPSTSCKDALFFMLPLSTSAIFFLWLWYLLKF